METKEAKFKVGDLVRRINSKEKKPLKIISASYIYYCGGQSWRYVLEDGLEAWEYNLVAHIKENRTQPKEGGKKRGRKKKHREAAE